jgi:hypothetical protein
MTDVPVPDTFEERVHCACHCALEAEANGEDVLLAECRHAIEVLIPVEVAEI